MCPPPQKPAKGFLASIREVLCEEQISESLLASFPGRRVLGFIVKQQKPENRVSEHEWEREVIGT